MADDAKVVVDKSQMTMSQAAEHYVDAFRRGTIFGALEEHDKIIKLLQDPVFQDDVDYHWKEDKTIYEVIALLIKTRGTEVKL